MTRGGDTPTPPVQTPAAQVFVDEACTTRPVAGFEYETLYVRVNRDFGFDDSYAWSIGDGDGGKLFVQTPTNDAPDDSYLVQLYVDWFSDDLIGPITAGSVVVCTVTGGVSAPSSLVVDFYDE